MILIWQTGYAVKAVNPRLASAMILVYLFQAARHRAVCSQGGVKFPTGGKSLM